MSKSALIIIDLQNDYFENGKFPLWNTDEVLKNIEAVIASARAKNIPIILVQHIADPAQGIAPFFNEGTKGVEIHPRVLAAAPEGIIITKNYADSFHNTELEKTLSRYGIQELLIAGMMTQNCVTHTALSKKAENYSLKVLADGCTSVSQIIHLIALNALTTRVALIESKAVLQ